MEDLWSEIYGKTGRLRDSIIMEHGAWSMEHVKVRELRTMLRSLEKAHLLEIVVEMYKALLKALAEGTN